MKTIITYAVGIILLSSCSSIRYAANKDYPMPKSDYIPEGCLTEVFYKPTIPGPSEKRMLVYLPPDYGGSSGRYPVLYLLHGARGNEISWIDRGDLLKNVDSLTRSGAMEETIIVLPNMNRYDDDEDFGKSRKKSSAESLKDMDGSVETAFTEDIVATVDSMFRTIPSKDSRAIAGLSIGGVQAMYISAAYPDMFGYVGIFSPFKKTLTGRGAYSDIYKDIRGKQAVQFADPPEMYWIMSGEYDIFNPRTRRFFREMEKKGYNIRYFSTPGRHTWKNWEAYSILFMENLWKY